MTIEGIRLKNFKVFQDVAIRDIPECSFFVGANGTGKSILFDAFAFLKDCLVFNVGIALQKRGGFYDVISRGHEQETLVLEIKDRLPFNKNSRIATYRVEIEYKEGKPAVAREMLQCEDNGNGQPCTLFEFSYGSGYAIADTQAFGSDASAGNKEEYKLGSADILALKGLGQFRKFGTACALRARIEGWHMSDIRADTVRGPKEAVGEEDSLFPCGSNLPLVVQNLVENHPKSWGEILEVLQRRIPDVNSVVPRQTLDGRLVLQFGSKAFKDPFTDKQISDGTLLLLASLVLLHEPHPHPLLCVAEPEKGLYPRILGELVDEFRIYAEKGGQVMLSSHSPKLLNAVELDEVFWLEKEASGFTRIVRARDNSQVATYMEHGDRMGLLWEHGYFGRVDPS